MLSWFVLLALQTPTPATTPSTPTPAATPTPTAATTTTTTALAVPLPAALVGVWALDLEASDDVTPLLDRFEVNFLMKAAARTMAPSHDIRSSSSGGVIVVTSPVKNSTIVVTTDGVTVDVGEMFGVPTRTIHRVEGEVLTSVSSLTLQQAEATLTTRRLRDGPRLVMSLELVQNGKPRLLLRRVFRRADAPATTAP